MLSLFQTFQLKCFMHRCMCQLPSAIRFAQIMVLLLLLSSFMLLSSVFVSIFARAHFIIGIWAAE
jgi:hypothetical protein